MIVLCIAVNVAVTAYCIHYLDKERVRNEKDC